MKIKVSKTFQKVLALVLCAVMVFGAAPLAGVLFTNANAEGTYTLTYFYYETKDGVSELTSKTHRLTEGEDVPEEPETSRIGYTQNGWDIEIPDVMPAKNLTITAMWKINQYTITFNTVGADDDIDPIEQDYNTAISVAKPVKEGYTFMGWDDDATAEVKAVNIPSKMPAKNMSFTAMWKINPYTIKFDTNGGSAVADISKDFGTEIAKPADPTKTGYNFTGWNPEVPETMPAKNMTITAQWELKTNTITFDTLGGSDISPITQKYNTVIVKPENPTYEGYTFAGWYDNEACTGNSIILPDTMPADSVTYYAKWTANTITITFDPNGGTVVDKEGNPTQNAIEMDLIFGTTPTLPTPTKSGYTFMGWFEEGAEDPLSSIPSAATTYYAKWKEGTGEASYEIKYYYMDTNGNYPSSAKETYEYLAEDGQVINITDAANSKVKVGHALDDEKNDSFIITAEAGKHHIFNVYIARQEYKIVLNADNGSELIELKGYYEAPITAINNPEKEGYTFKGWENNSTGAVEIIPSKMPAANMNFTAQWENNSDTKYSIVINYEDATKNGKAATKEYQFAGTTGNKIKILIDGNAANDGAIYHKLADFTLEHYKFDTSVMANQQLEGTIAADGSTVLNLYFAPVTYKVYFVVSGETVATEEVVYYTNANDVKPTTEFMNDVFAEKMPGYTFKGWEPTFSNIDSDTTYTATYTANPYTITFDYDKAIIDNDGNIKLDNENISPKEEVEAITQDFNTVVTIPAKPEKDGYSCLCWYDENLNVYNPGSKIKMPVDGLYLTAYFIANTYTITFDTNLEGATLKTKSASDDCDEYIEITEDMIPAKEGYTFLGWYDYKYTDENGEPKVYNVGDTVLVPTHDHTLVAEWAVGEFALIFKDNTDNGKIIAKYEDMASDVKITAPDYPKAANLKGRTFLGWREEGKKAGDPLFVFDKMPGRSMILEAVWGYTITFELNTDDATAALTSAKTVTKEIGVATKMSEISNPTRTGYSFTGWYSDEEITEESIPVGKSVSYAKDVTLYAGWEINSYTMTLIADSEEETGVFANGKKEIVITQDYNTDITAPVNPTKVGYTFAGWKDQNNKSYSAVPAKMPATDLILTAQWSINSYSVVFKDADGTIYKSEVLTYGSEITAPENPARIGRIFKGWNAAIPETVPAYDVVITAKWEFITYTITFVDTNGKVLDTVSGHYGSEVRDVEEPSKWFYTFAGWDKEVPETMPAEDMTITATWEKNPGIFDYLASFFMSFFAFLNQILDSISLMLK